MLQLNFINTKFIQPTYQKMKSVSIWINDLLSKESTKNIALICIIKRMHA